MIAYIKGILAETEGDRIVVETGGIGYQIFVPLSVFDRLPARREQVQIYTYFAVREDAMSLYGFLTRDDREVFRLLLGVNGIGPKAALGVLSTLTPDELRMAVLSGDEKAIARAPGLGKKTAQKVILELKDKMSLQDALDKFSEHAGQTAGTAAAGTANISEAVAALQALGYSASESMAAVRKIEGTAEMDVEEILKQALKYLL